MWGTSDFTSSFMTSPLIGAYQFQDGSDRFRMLQVIFMQNQHIIHLEKQLSLHMPWGVGRNMQTIGSLSQFVSRTIFQTMFNADHFSLLSFGSSFSPLSSDSCHSMQNAIRPTAVQLYAILIPPAWQTFPPKKEPQILAVKNCTDY